MLKRFDKRKELKKLKNKKYKNARIKKSTTVLSIFILVGSIIYFTFARFESNKSFIIVDAKVGDFKTYNQTISYVYDGSSYSVAPSKESGYTINNISCDNASGTWDESNWELIITDVTGTVNCSVSFNSPYSNSTIASAPQLYDGFIPVTIDESGDEIGTVRVADTTAEWYSYENHKWANAVLVTDTTKYETYKTATPGTEISQSDIAMMYVWIPRYRYKLWNAENGSSNEQMIEIEFEDKDAQDYQKATGSSNGEWLTHPAFTFGETELSGIWVGKFETASTSYTSGQATNFGCTSISCSNVTTLRIVPSVNVLRNQTLQTMFWISRAIETGTSYGLNSSEIDTHMMKNMDWGAVAYLSSSKYGLYTDENTCANSDNNITVTLKDGSEANRCEIWINPHYSSYTRYSGCSGTTMDSDIQATCIEWNDATYGGNASTTGNMTGVYDMNGGGYEYVMGNVNTSGSEETYYLNNATYAPDLSDDDLKYVDIYSNNTLSGIKHENGKLGDATKETLKTYGGREGSWFGSTSLLPFDKSEIWIARGGLYSQTTKAGIFGFYRGSGSASDNYTFRIVLTAQDGNS